MGIPSTIVFPQEVVDRFILVRAALLEEIRTAQDKEARQAELDAQRARARVEDERRRMRELERLAGQEHMIDKNDRWVAWVPFGVGQFQNRDYALGGLFLASETILAGTALGAVAIELSLHAQAEGGRGGLTTEETNQLNRNLQVAHTVSLVAAGTFVVTALLGIAEANLSFVPEFDAGTRKRPPGVKRISRQTVAPTVVPFGSGAGVGLTGSF